MVDPLARNDLGGNSKITGAGIGGRSDARLVELLPSDITDPNYVSGTRGPGDERLNLREVDLVVDVILGVLVGAEFHPVPFAALRPEEAPDLFVGRKNSRGCAKLRAHVRDDVSIHGGK